MLTVLVVCVVLIATAGAIASRVASAGPGSGLTAVEDALLLKDGKDDDSDDDDSSGHGNGEDSDDDSSGHGSGHDDDDDHDGGGDYPRPEIPAKDLGVVVIEIIDEQFVPANATLKAGESVTFINLDDDDHTATGIGFDTGTIAPGGWKTVKLTKGGDAPFTCQYHPEMLGTLTVEGDATPIAASPVAASPVAITSKITIDIVDYAFETPDAEVEVGTEITWTNTGVAPHTVTGSFGDSGLILPGDSFVYVVTESGTFEYVCQFHPEMTARLTVVSRQ